MFAFHSTLCFCFMWNGTPYNCHSAHDTVEATLSNDFPKHKVLLVCISFQQINSQLKNYETIKSFERNIRNGIFPIHFSK